MMSFAEWRKWLGNLPATSKWFAILVLIRPLIDNFYFLKDISPLLSPLYVAGVLTPVFIVFSFLSRSFRPKYRSPIADLVFGTWGVLVVVNSLIVLLSDYSLSTLGEVIKYTTPVLLFFYARHIISSKEDLTGFLQAFLIGCILPAAILIYEQIFGAISPEQLTEKRGGGERTHGAYADVMSYAIYIIGSFLVSTYLFLKDMKGKRRRRMPLWLLLVIALDVLALVSIKQVSTFAVFATLMTLFLFHLLQNKRSLILLALALPLVLIIGKYIYDKNVKVLVAKEVAVIDGEADVDRSFNGRMHRWERYFELWGEMPGYTSFVGVPSSGFKEVPLMISGGMHSDFVRLLFFTGFLGLTMYLFFLFIVFLKSNGLRSYDRYLAWGALGALLLHSVSTTPLMYASYNYLFVIVFSYVLLPQRIKNAKA